MSVSVSCSDACLSSQAGYTALLWDVALVLEAGGGDPRERLPAGGRRVAAAAACTALSAVQALVTHLEALRAPMWMLNSSSRCLALWGACNTSQQLPSAL